MMILKMPLIMLWIESINAEKSLIRHTSKVKDEVSLQKIEEKDKQFLIKKITSNVEKKSVRNRGRKKSWHYA